MVYKVLSVFLHFFHYVGLIYKFHCLFAFEKLFLFPQNAADHIQSIEFISMNWKNFFHSLLSWLVNSWKLGRKFHANILRQ